MKANVNLKKKVEIFKLDVSALKKELFERLEAIMKNIWK